MSFRLPRFRIPRIPQSVRPYTPLVTLPLWTAAVVIFLNDHVAETIVVTGRSMSPTLSPLYHETGQTDSVLLRKHNVTTDLARGDVVAFWAPHKANRVVIKRVLGLEGDRIWLDPRRFGRRTGTSGGEAEEEGEGQELEHEGMRALARQWGDDPLHPHVGLGGEEKGAVRVPYGHVWVEGDNWRDSDDSNLYGPISKSLIFGKAICVISPWEKCGSRPWELERKEQGGTRVEITGWGEMVDGGGPLD